MPRKRHSTEQTVTKLRQAEIELGPSVRTPKVCAAFNPSSSASLRRRRCLEHRRRDAPELEFLTTGKNRGRELVRMGCGQDENHVRGGFFQGFQKGVERGGRELVAMGHALAEPLVEIAGAASSTPGAAASNDSNVLLGSSCTKETHTFVRRRRPVFGQSTLYLMKANSSPAASFPRPRERLPRRQHRLCQ